MEFFAGIVFAALIVFIAYKVLKVKAPKSTGTKGGRSTPGTQKK